MADSHFTQIAGRFRISSGNPPNPATGDIYWDSAAKDLYRYSGNNWLGFNLSAGTAATAAPTGTPATGTHVSSLAAEFRTATTAPTLPLDGDFYYDTSNNQLVVYDATAARWYTASFSTTTSTSTSTTTTSTSTSTSTSTTTSTSTSTTTTSTSTTTTL